MFTKRVLMTLVAMGLIASAGTALADGIRDAGAKIRGDYGDRRPRAVYRQSVPARVAIAPQASAARSYSLDPSRAGGGLPCPTAQPSAPVAERPAQAQRSYSFEPGYGSYRSSSRSMRSRTPAYMLPKTDPRKYRGF